uniref:Uncharacterized protein n=1 Tax=Macrostomum lignano TaxID=282301 RepID=A0A1I8ITD0_9PLAT
MRQVAQNRVCCFRYSTGLRRNNSDSDAVDKDEQASGFSCHLVPCLQQKWRKCYSDSIRFHIDISKQKSTIETEDLAAGCLRKRELPAGLRDEPAQKRHLPDTEDPAHSLAQRVRVQVLCRAHKNLAETSPRLDPRAMARQGYGSIRG